MQYREKLGYIALGGCLVLIGMLAAGSLAPLKAQKEAVDLNVGKITCASLKVVDGGEVIIGGKDGVSEVMITGERVGVFDKEGKERVGLSISKYGGRVEVLSFDGNVGAVVDVTEGGGIFYVKGKDGKPKAFMNIDEHGNGFAATVDKNGNVSWTSGGKN